MTRKIVVAPPWERDPLGEVRVPSQDEVDLMVRTARASASTWAAVPPWQRSQPLEDAARALATAAESIGQLLARESGKIVYQAIEEVRGAAYLMRRNADLGREETGRLLPTGSLPGTDGDLAWERRVPLGVVVAIIPFNFPVELLVEKAAAALVAGNVVIVKPPEQDPLAVTEVVRLIHEAGIPNETLQIAHGDAAVGAFLAEHPDVDAVSLTGSTNAGRSVAAGTARALRRLHLELGGNDPAIVLEDADLDLVVPELVRGRLLMNGQSCASNKRVIAARPIAEELERRLVERLSTVRACHPLEPGAELGPLIDEKATARVIGQARTAVGEGARLALGALEAQGAFVDPIVLTDVPHRSQVARDDEIFGPVFTLLTVVDDDEAISVANASSMGLMGCVFSRDLARALAVADRLETGGVVINGTGNYRPPFVPFGGVKLSGSGREGIGYTVEELTRLRFWVLRRIRAH